MQGTCLSCAGGLMVEDPKVHAPPPAGHIPSLSGGGMLGNKCNFRQVDCQPKHFTQINCPCELEPSPAVTFPRFHSAPLVHVSPQTGHSQMLAASATKRYTCWKMLDSKCYSARVSQVHCQQQHFTSSQLPSRTFKLKSTTSQNISPKSTAPGSYNLN